MKKHILLFTAVLVASAALASPPDEWMDKLDDFLTVNALNGDVRARLSGTIDLEGYALEQPAPGLLFTNKETLFNPRLTLFLDGQLGRKVYVFAQFRADRGFDPGAANARASLDEYALR